MTVAFEKGVDAKEYLSDLKYYRSLVRRLLEQAQANEEHAERLRAALQGYPQPVRASAMTEDWCGDSACNLPILESLFGGSGVPFTVFHGSEYSELESYYHRMGVDHIPVISLWDGEGAEIGRFVEQPAVIGPLKDAWKADRPEFMELYAKRDTDKDAGRRFASLYRELLEQMAEWYTTGMWENTTGEVVTIAENGTPNRE